MKYDENMAAVALIKFLTRYGEKIKMITYEGYDFFSFSTDKHELNKAEVVHCCNSIWLVLPVIKPVKAFGFKIDVTNNMFKVLEYER